MNNLRANSLADLFILKYLFFLSLDQRTKSYLSIYLSIYLTCKNVLFKQAKYLFTQLNGFNYCYLILTIQLKINHLFAHT